ncbi:hypothetical protein ACFVR1_07055 [Psychrobacillus sp. NPDC058041]|uniref:hypothetical protein n=1 Tax=Psychrobacillus sp. NPDC058041 TaxID=3346310 RepID=UPI0036DCEF10
MKEVITLIAIVICLTVGGTALANEKSPTDYIKDMMFSILNPILLDVEEHVQKRGEYYADQIAALVQETREDVSLELILWKEQEEARAERELEDYYNLLVAELQASMEKESEASKLDITNKTNLEIEQGKAAIEEALKPKNDIDGNEESELNNENKNETVNEEDNLLEPVTTETEYSIEVDEN